MLKYTNFVKVMKKLLVESFLLVEPLDAAVFDRTLAKDSQEKCGNVLSTEDSLHFLFLFLL